MSNIINELAAAIKNLQPGDCLPAMQTALLKRNIIEALDMPLHNKEAGIVIDYYHSISKESTVEQFSPAKPRVERLERGFRGF